MEIYLIRHTTPDVTPGFIYGRTDVALAGSFLTEMVAIRQKLPVPFDAVYSSPAQRCTQLAEQLTPTFLVDDRLWELDFGDWEGKTWDSINPDESEAWMADFVNVRTPNGESMVQMNERVTAFWTELIQKRNKSVAVVTHGGVIRLLTAANRQLPLAKAFTINVDYGDVLLLHPR